MTDERSLLTHRQEEREGGGTGGGPRQPEVMLRSSNAHFDTSRGQTL